MIHHVWGVSGPSLPAFLQVWDSCPGGRRQHLPCQHFWTFGRAEGPVAATSAAELGRALWSNDGNQPSVHDPSWNPRISLKRYPSGYPCLCTTLRQLEAPVVGKYNELRHGQVSCAVTRASKMLPSMLCSWKEGEKLSKSGNNVFTPNHSQEFSHTSGMKHNQH